jgi:hypothetical protein
MPAGSHASDWKMIDVHRLIDIPVSAGYGPRVEAVFGRQLMDLEGAYYGMR